MKSETHSIHDQKFEINPLLPACKGSLYLHIFALPKPAMTTAAAAAKMAANPPVAVAARPTAHGGAYVQMVVLCDISSKE